MWYLIVPPIVVVASLSFVLWYLSLKGSDPLVAGKALKSEEEAGRKIAFSRIRRFFLRLLEKIAYRFKVASLRSHNTLHDLTQSLKASQRRFQSPASSESRDVPTSSSPPRYDGLRRFFEKENGRDIAVEKDFPSETAPTEAVLDVPILRSRRGVSQTEYSTTAVLTSSPAEDPLASRPMVSETATHPERARKRIQGNHLREEDLIARIAANPKDFAAYEGLGDYYLEVDNVKDAKECYRQVLKLSPVQRMVKIKIRRLEKILSQKTGGGTG